MNMLGWLTGQINEDCIKNEDNVEPIITFLDRNDRDGRPNNDHHVLRKKGGGGYHQVDDKYAGAAGEREEEGGAQEQWIDNITEDLKEYNMTETWQKIEVSGTRS